MQAQVWLVISDEGQATRFPLAQGDAVVGRGGSATIPIVDPAASRAHLRITLEGDRVWVEDLGSRNGTLLQGRRLTERMRWPQGKPIEIGRTSLTWQARAPQAPERGTSKASPALARPSRGLGLQLPLRGGGLLGPTGAALVALLVLGTLLSLASGGEAAYARPAETRVALDGETAHLVFGSAEGDLLVDGALVLEWARRHPTQESLVWLRFQLDLESGHRGLGLELNGLPIGEVRGEGTQWVSLLLPSDLVEAEGGNRLVMTPGATEEAAWVIWGLEIVEEPRPPCEGEACVEVASRLLERGRDAWDRDALAEGNLFDAWESFHQARIHLENVHPKPEIYATAMGLHEEAGQRLQERCSQLRFSVIQALAFGREARAAQEAERFLRAFPHPSHPCHERAQDLVRRLGAGGDTR